MLGIHVPMTTATALGSAHRAAGAQMRNMIALAGGIGSVSGSEGR